jgi:hypothetical protein
MAGADPYAVLGVSPNAPPAEVRTAYRRLVQLHHPDHNGGSAESARRFEEVQEAYATVLARHRQPPPAGAPAADPHVDAQLADLERQVREAHEARERARRAAQEAAAVRGERRASDEELGYIKTEDSFSKVLADALDELSDWLRRRN